MACVGDFEVVADSQNVVFDGTNSTTVTLDAPEGKHAIFGWLPNQDVQLLGSHPSSDGTAWNFVVRSFNAGTIAVDLAMTCAALG